MKRILILVATIAAMLSAVPASATTLLYSITGTNGFSANFALDDTTARSPYFPNDFYVFDVAGIYSDGSTLAGLTFYDTSIDPAETGGLTVLTSNFLEASFTGLTLFSGTLTNPTLIAFGPATFFDYYDSSITYTASAAFAAAVPEPATWAMLLLGFGMIGVVARRRAPIAVPSRA